MRQAAANVLNWDFSADRPNQRWLADITYLDTLEGFLYLAGVLDVFSRRLVGWAMVDHLREDLVEDTLRLALAQRRPGHDLLHHSEAYGDVPFKAANTPVTITWRCSLSTASRSA